MTTRIDYSTYYTNGEINGYVIAEDKGNYYVINKRQFNNACKKLSIVNTRPNFHADKPVYVYGIDF